MSPVPLGTLTRGDVGVICVIGTGELGSRPPDLPTRAGSGVAGSKARVIGVDVARGLALIGMMATHAYGAALDDDGVPTSATVVAGGRGATLFVLGAGVSPAFLSGGRAPARGAGRAGAAAPPPRGSPPSGGSPSCRRGTRR